MNSRALPLINAVGCLALTGLVVVQWRKERILNNSLGNLKSELAATREIADAETRHRSALERDIEVLKETIAATQQAAERSTRALADKDVQAAGHLAELNAAREKIALWEASLKARDERIQALDANLSATRKRLEEAIAKLKTAGAE